MKKMLLSATLLVSLGSNIALAETSAPPAPPSLEQTENFTDIFKLNKGWNLVGSSHPITFANKAFDNPNVVAIFVYQNGKWAYYSNQLKLKLPVVKSVGPNAGFWIYAKNKTVIEYKNLNTNNDNNLTSNLTVGQKYIIADLWNKLLLESDVLHDMFVKVFYNLNNLEEQKAEKLRAIIKDIYVAKLQDARKLVDIAQKYDFDITDIDGNFSRPFNMEKTYHNPGVFSMPQYKQAYMRYSNEIENMSPEEALLTMCKLETDLIKDLKDKELDLKDNEDVIQVLKEIEEDAYKIQKTYDLILKEDFEVTDGCCADRSGCL